MSVRTFLLMSILAGLPRPAAALDVAGATPSGPAESAGDARAIAVTFSEPMVPLSSPKESEGFCPLELQPRIEGRCRWQGTQVLTFEPASPLPPATAFSARVPAGTRSKVSGGALEADYSWTFETVRPALLKSWPNEHEHWIALKPTILLQFNLGMDPKRARGALTLEETPLDDSVHIESVPVAVRRASSEEVKGAWPYAWWGVDPSTHNVLAVVPSRPLKADRAYVLRLAADLRSAEGELGLAAPRELDFETYYSFRFLGSRPGVPFCLPGEAALLFSNPVKYKDLAAALSFDPPVAMAEMPDWLKEHAGERRPRERQVFLRLPGPDL
ncbi:MAG TPA: Ig-like domain-containing protein, partial [Elusimicrobiota bacterium]|nr:Ig-like domain-containing protein [Elusimicrobiota bacterium]